MKIAIHDGNGRLSDIRETGTDFPVGGTLEWVSVPDDTTSYDTWNGSAVVKHVPIPAAKIAISKLEAQITNRRLRDAIQGTENPTNWLADQEAKIKTERDKL